MVFDVRSNLTYKSWPVAGGHLTDPPKDLTYSSVVTWDSVQIAFTIDAFNDLDVGCRCAECISECTNKRMLSYDCWPGMGHEQSQLTNSYHPCNLWLEKFCCQGEGAHLLDII